MGFNSGFKGLKCVLGAGKRYAGEEEKADVIIGCVLAR